MPPYLLSPSAGKTVNGYSTIPVRLAERFCYLVIFQHKCLQILLNFLGLSCCNDTSSWEGMPLPKLPGFHIDRLTIRIRILTVWHDSCDLAKADIWHEIIRPYRPKPDCWS